MSLASERRDPRRFATVSASIALALVLLFALTARAQATETIYWDNYSADPDNVAYADITGAGGGVLNLGGATLEGPEGMAYDTVTNRLFVGEDNGILAINLDGSGASSFTAPGAVINDVEGVTVNPATRTIYWINTSPYSIGWANLDGGNGGLLNTTGAIVDEPYRGIAIDPVANRLYWSNGGPEPEIISYANADNSGGGGTLDLSGAPAPEDITGLVADPAGGRLYWLDNADDRIAYVSLTGGNGGEVNPAGAVFDSPYGLSFDPSLGRFYLGNYGNDEEATNAIGVANLNGGGGAITPAVAPVNGLQDPLVLKSPTAAGAPTITRNPKVRTELACSQGTWGADYPGSLVYQAPRSYAYQWTVDGALLGSGPATITAFRPGNYGCSVTAVNQTGSAVQTSAAAIVKAAKLKLTTKKKARSKAGKLVKFKVKAVNQGDLRPNKVAKVCVKLPKSARDDLKKPKCKKLGKLNGRARKAVIVKLRVKGGADKGAAKVVFKVRGAGGKAAKSRVVVR